jgi:hypothetical protein
MDFRIAAPCVIAPVLHRATRCPFDPVSGTQ